jgi:hypothetical protein
LVEMRAVPVSSTYAQMSARCHADAEGQCRQALRHQDLVERAPHLSITSRHEHGIPVRISLGNATRIIIFSGHSEACRHRMQVNSDAVCTQAHMRRPRRSPTPRTTGTLERCPHRDSHPGMRAVRALLYRRFRHEHKCADLVVIGHERTAPMACVSYRRMEVDDHWRLLSR